MCKPMALAFALSCALLTLSVSTNLSADAADGAPHTLNLKDADINVLIATVSEITGKTFIVDPRVQGKVNVVSSQPLSKPELYQLFLSVLRVNGFVAIDAGNAIRVMPESQAASDGAVGLGMAMSDEMRTQIVELKHVSPAEIVQLLNPLKSASAQLIAHPGSSSLVIADRGSNIVRMVEIIRRIDMASQADVEIVPLNNANATEVVRTLNGLAAGGEANPQKIVADERTNSVLISGDRNRRLKFRTLLASLDTPLAGSGSMEVIYLRYADAETLVPILEGVLQGSRAPGGAPLTNTGGAGGSGTAAGTGSSSVIQAHQETNSLIITAPPAVLKELKMLVRQLDIRRAQVLIEAIVAEVTDEKAKQLGIQWQGTDNDFNDRGLIGGTNFPSPGPGIVNTQGALANPATGIAALGGSAGLNIGYILGSVKLPGSNTEIIQLGALATALASDGKGNVLSQPSTIALDHQKATLSVGQEVPFLTGRFQTGSTAGGVGTDPNSGQQSAGLINPFQTIDRKEVGLKLVVTPHINEGTAVRMEIELEISSLAPNVQGASDLITNTRKLSTQAIVRNGGMLVLGGLTSNEVRETESRVPGLGRIPILGELFKTRGSSVSRRNLLVFIRPTIARDAITEDAISFGKYTQIRDEQINAQNNRSWLTPRDAMPILPNIRDYLDEAPMQAMPTPAPPKQ